MFKRLGTKGLFLVLISLQFIVVSTYAETTQGPSIEFENPIEAPPAANEQRFEEYEVAAAPVAIIIGIFARAALQIVKRRIQKGFSEQAARTAVRAIREGRMRKLRDSVCFAVEAAGRSRVVLAADRTTVLFAGSHEAYNNFINGDFFTRSCRGGPLVGSYFDSNSLYL